MREGTRTLVFDDLTAAPSTGVTLERSRIEVSLPEGRFPIVAAEIHVKAFDVDRWRRAFGNNPFHFLTVGVPDATVLHEHGRLVPTPTADPYPMLDAPLESAAGRLPYPYNRQWTALRPADHLAMPVVGLWAPASRLYAGWDLLGTGVLAGPDLSIACCNRLLLPPARGSLDDARASADRQADRRGESRCVAIVYRGDQRPDRQFDYPHGGETLAVAAQLVFDGAMDESQDPNRLLWQTWWSDGPIGAAMRRAVPVPGDLAERGPSSPDAGPSADVAGGARAAGESATGQKAASLTGRDGWSRNTAAWIAANPAEEAYRRGNATEIGQWEREAALLLRNASHYFAAHDRCVYWPTPWGASPSSSRAEVDRTDPRLHHSAGWAAGRLLLALYRHSSKVRVLPAIEGVFAWSKHVVWQRWAGAPAETSVTDEALRIAYLLDYYRTFRTDFDRRQVAMEALDMAHTGAFRALTMRPISASLPAFGWETASAAAGPVGGEPLAAVLDVLADVAVTTGDPILLWAVCGSMERGLRAEKDSVHLRRNVDATPDLRIFAGEKAVLVAASGGGQASVSAGRRSGSGDLALVFHGSAGLFTAIVTAPGLDVGARRVSIVRDRLIRIPVRPGSGLSGISAGGDTFAVTGLRGGDELEIGDPDVTATESLYVPPARARPAPTHNDVARRR
jgi:hypothetical protein